jgi:hypothetical protein
MMISENRRWHNRLEIFTFDAVLDFVLQRNSLLAHMASKR